MPNVEIKTLIAQEIEAQLGDLLGPLLQRFEEVDQERAARIKAFTVREVEARLTPLKETVDGMHKALGALLLQLAETNRALGTDPGEAELDPNYRN
jgi:hypothetical protein